MDEKNLNDQEINNGQDGAGGQGGESIQGGRDSQSGKEERGIQSGQDSQTSRGIQSGQDSQTSRDSQKSQDGQEKKTSQDSGHSHDDQEYEKICYMCHRPESKAGAMVTMPGGLSLCNACMQRTFDTFASGGLDLSRVDLSKIPGMPFMSVFPGMPGMPGAPGTPDGPAGTQEWPQTPGSKKLKKRKAGKEPGFQLRDIPLPHKTKQQLDAYVVGQDHAKKVISVAVYNHYKRVWAESMRKDKKPEDQPEEDVQIEKSNILMIGPTGSGKTYLVKTLARLLNVPLAIADATSLTEAGYIGDDIESVVSKLLTAAGNDVEKAERGIIFIDEIDKIAKKRNTNTRDVSGESVQQELLKLLEGSDVEVPVGSNQKNAMTPMTTVNTDNILFICGGAFPDLERIIKERLSKKAAMGFGSVLKDQFQEDPNILSHVTSEDLRSFGMIPEFLGRLPVTVTLEKLTESLLVQILKEPRNAILKQYAKLLEMDEVKLVFEDEALEWIAQEALKRDTGARALRAVLEEFMLDIMYEIPKDPNIGSVIITRPYLEKTGGPLIQMRG